MINDDVMNAIAEWVGEVIPAIGDKTYPYQPGGKQKGLPDAVASLASEGPQREPPDEFPAFQLQQAGCYVWRCGVSIMVSAGETEGENEAADATLREYARALFDALASDPFLGARLTDHAQASVWSFDFDYNQNGPLVEYEDGLIGREATFTLAVAEPISILD